MIDYIDLSDKTKVVNDESFSFYGSMSNTHMFVNIINTSNYSQYQLMNYFEMFHENKKQLKKEQFLLDAIKNFLRKENFSELLEELENENINEDEFESIINKNEDKFVIKLKDMKDINDILIIKELVNRLGNEIKELTISDVSEIFSLKEEDLILNLKNQLQL